MRQVYQRIRSPLSLYQPLYRKAELQKFYNAGHHSHSRLVSRYQCHYCGSDYNLQVVINLRSFPEHPLIRLILDIVSLAFISVGWLLLLKLLLFHAYLAKIGSTTYETILRKRNRVVNKRILEHPAELAANSRQDIDESRDELFNPNKLLNGTLGDFKTNEFDVAKHTSHNVTNNSPPQTSINRARQENGSRLTQCEDPLQAIATLQVISAENINNQSSLHTLNTADDSHHMHYLSDTATKKDSEQPVLQ